MPVLYAVCWHTAYNTDYRQQLHRAVSKFREWDCYTKNWGPGPEIVRHSHVYCTSVQTTSDYTAETETSYCTAYSSCSIQQLYQPQYPDIEAGTSTNKSCKPEPLPHTRYECFCSWWVEGFRALNCTRLPIVDDRFVLIYCCRSEQYIQHTAYIIA